MSYRNRTRKPYWQLTRLEDRLTPAVQLLPDLHVLGSYLSGWTINDLGGGNRELRFSTGMANGGQGAFELRGTTTIINNPDGTQSQGVNQRIYYDDGTFQDRPAGFFTYHPTHGHVHFDDFAWGQLRTRPTANWQDGAVVAIGPKTSFCLIDINRYNGSLPGSPTSGKYNSCGSAVQGISVGWNDVYGSGLDGQSIDITGLPNGDYWLEVVADPQDSILELDETNNTSRLAISLTNQPAVGLRVLSSSPVGANNDPVSSVTLNFNATINELTFTTADVNFKGPAGTINPTGITKLSATSYRVDFPAQPQAGTYTMNIGPNIEDTNGNKMNQNNNGTAGEDPGDVFNHIFTVTTPRVSGTTPNGGTAPPVSSIRVTYNKPMDVATFTMADIVSFTGPGGVDLYNSISGIVPLTTGTSAVYDINFTAQSGLGAYSMVIEPNVSDPWGNTVDQNGDLVTDSNDRLTASFTIAPPGVVGPDAFGYTARSTNFENITGLTGWTTIVNTADDANGSFNLGTNTFNFYGTTYTGSSKIFANSNGLITFGQGSSSYTNNDLGSISYNSSTIYVPAIAVMWDDWINGGVTPQVRGLMQDVNGDLVMDRLIIEWNQVKHYQPGTSASSLTFQAILQLNTGNTPGTITLNYPDLDAGEPAYNNGASATVGIRPNGQGSNVLLISQNSGSNSLLSSGKAIRVSVPTVQSITRLNSNPNSTGESEFRITFSEGVTGFDEDQLSLTTTGSIAGAVIDHVHTTADPAVYEVHVKSYTGSGTIRIDMNDTDLTSSLLGAKLGGLGNGNGSFTKGETYDIVQPPPAVFGTNVADGTAQRSLVRQVQVVFDWPVQFLGGAGNAAAAFQLTGPSGNVPVTVDLSTSTPEQTFAKLTFSGAGTEMNGSLMNGLYTLTVVGANISTGGVNLDGDGNGSAGGDFVLNFHRLFGDANGDARVTAFDFNLFRQFYGTSSALNVFDSDGDNAITAADFNVFRNHYGMTLVP